MSGFLPAGTTLQLSDVSGNINHQGVLTSSVNGTPLLGATFPTTSTGTSTCHAHYTDPSTKSLKFLNASASGIGGHEFWVSTSTSAPIKTAQIDISGCTINKNTQVNLYNTYNVLLASSTFIIMNYNPSGAPYNWVRYNMYVIRVGNSTATMSTGVDYNVQYTDTQKIEVHTTSDPNSPRIDSTGITSVLLPYGSTGVNNTAILSSNDLTFNNVSLPSQVSTNTSNIATNTSNIATNTSNIATNTSNIATNTSNIATNTSNIATNTTNISALKIKQTNLIYQFASPAIYADARPMIATPTSVINSYGVNGWYFINSFASGVNKINWYIAPDNGMVVSDVLGLYLRFLNLSTTSNDNTMFLTVYTKLQASGNYASWYHSAITYTLDSSITPVVNTNYTMFMNVSTTCPNPSYYATTLVPMQISSVAPNPKGTYDGTDEILAFSIGTNSASPINSVEFVLQKFGIMTATKGTQEFQFAPLI